MIGRDEQRERVVEALARHLLATGLSQTSLRQLAAAAGVSDRMLLYYFTDKTEVLAGVMQRLAGEMAAHLGQAIPDGAILSPGQLIARAARMVIDDTFRPYMRLWIEVVAAAARDAAPFAEIAGQVTAGFLAWIEAHLDPATTPDIEGVAAMILALIDGLALVEVCAGRDRALAAVKFLERDGL
jgi:AcrR family transcriptional regulator